LCIVSHSKLFSLTKPGFFSFFALFHYLNKSIFQCGVTSYINEISSKQNEIESKYFQWQQSYEENRSKLNQRVEWCQFLDDKYKVCITKKDLKLHENIFDSF
jgi:hypothetical protein